MTFAGIIFGVIALLLVTLTNQTDKVSTFLWAIVVLSILAVFMDGEL